MGELVTMMANLLKHLELANRLIEKLWFWRSARY